MKTKILFHSIAVILTVLICSDSVVAQSMFGSSDKNRKTLKAVNKSIRKESKKLQREGYENEPGSPGIEWQLRNSYEKQFATDEDGENLYLVGVGSAIGGIQNVARRHAASDAQIDACTQLESRILGMIENDYNNKLYSRKEYESLSRMRGVFSNLLAQTLPIGTPLCTLLKDNGKIYSYQVRVAYPAYVLQEKAQEVIGEILGKENDALRKKMERVTGLNNLGSDSINQDLY